MSIGYACIAMGVKNAALSGTTIKNADAAKLRKITEANLKALEKMIDYNIENDIKLFRVSSDIIPFASHPINQQAWWVEYKSLFAQIGAKIKTSGMRVSMHPGQYTVLNSPQDLVVKRATQDLSYHALFLDTLETDTANKIILHIGGIYGEKENAIERFKHNYKRLPIQIKKRLVIENDEKSYPIQDVLEIGNDLNIPVVFDQLHHRINPPEDNRTELEWIKLCGATWHKETDGNQKLHYSEQAVNGRPGAHASSIAIHPFLEFYNQLKDMNVDVMLEVKDKNISALKCIYCTKEDVEKKYLEKEWERYKYTILERSNNSSLQIRSLFSGQEHLDAMAFYDKIEASLRIEPVKGSAVNAIRHIWGYFKDNALTSEKRHFLKLMHRIESEEVLETANIYKMKNYLLKLALKYNQESLIESYYFII